MYGVCTYVYFSLDLLALGALTPALILTLQVVWSITRDYTRSNPAHAQQIFFFSFFLSLLSCCPNNNMAVLAQSTLWWRTDRTRRDCLPGWHFVLRASEMLISTFYYTINRLSTGRDPIQRRKSKHYASRTETSNPPKSPTVDDRPQSRIWALSP